MIPSVPVEIPSNESDEGLVLLKKKKSRKKIHNGSMATRRATTPDGIKRTEYAIEEVPNPVKNIPINELPLISSKEASLSLVKEKSQRIAPPVKKRKVVSHIGGRSVRAIFTPRYVLPQMI